MRGIRLGLGALLACGLLLACGFDNGYDGDCNARVRLDGDTFRPVNGLHLPVRGEALGQGEYLDCDGTPVAGLGVPEVFEVVGVDPTVAVLVTDAGSESVYLNTSGRYRDRPKLLKQAEQFPKCRQPAQFVASWNFIDPEDVPSLDDFASAEPPYTVLMKTSEGTGLPLDRWSLMQLEVEVTEATKPTPTGEFLTEANTEGQLIEVETVCSGDNFVATRLALTGE